MTSPADYAARLTRLQMLGVGEGGPEGLIHYADHSSVYMRINTYDSMGYETTCQYALPDDLATRILESCLRDALIDCPAVLFRQEDRLIHIVTAEDAYSHVYLGRCLLEAADAVIAHMEVK